MKSKSKFIIIVIAVLFVYSNNNYAQQKKIAGNLDTFYSTQLKKYNLAAISAGIVKEKSLVWSGAYGFKDINTKEIVSPNTLFHQGSISKTITLAAFLGLCEQKNIDLNENINEYLPFEVKNPYHPKEPITFKMLLTHTSSFSDVYIGINKMAMLNSNQDTPEKLGVTMKNILSEEGEYYSESYFLTLKPGMEYAYSNLAYSLIGYLIEQISEESFIDYCIKNIFDPLKMKNTTFLLSKTDTTNFAYQYSYSQANKGKLVKIQPYTWPGYMDGSLRTSVSEYSNFLIMLINKGEFEGNQVLSKKTIETMIELQDLPGKQKSRLFKAAGRAILWNKQKVRINNKDIEVYTFDGFGSGFFTQVFFSIDENFACMFFTTGQYKSFVKMAFAIRRNTLKMLKSADEL